MPIFDKSTTSLFETLGRSRETVLAKKTPIPPPGTLQRPGMKVAAPPAKGPRVPTSVLERAVDDLLDVDGDPILVIDDELDVSSLTAEDAIIDEPPTQILGVRADTAVVFGIGLCLVVAIAYFAGRTTTKPGDLPKAAAILAKPPVQAPLEKPQPAPIEKPAEAAADEPAPQPAPQAAQPAPKPANDGNFEVLVVSTNEANATKVAKWFNDDMESPIYKKGLTAYVKKSSLGGCQVRIKGLEKEDPAMLAAIQGEKDPTNNQTGAFKGAVFRKIAAKK